MTFRHALLPVLLLVLVCCCCWLLLLILCKGWCCCVWRDCFMLLGCVVVAVPALAMLVLLFLLQSVVSRCLGVAVVVFGWSCLYQGADLLQM